MYKAIITTVNLKIHPTADRLEICTIDSGEQIVVGRGIYKENEKVIFCPEGGCLSHEFVFNNSEYRKGEGINKDPEKFGFFEEKRRVKIIKLRTEISNGYIIRFDAFNWLGPNNLASLPVGTELDTVVCDNGSSHQFCEKYFTKATRERMVGEKNKPGEPKVRFSISGFDRHFDTSQLARHIRSLPETAVYYISLKIHATSGRTGYLACSYSNPPTTWYDKAYHKFMGLIGKNQSTDITKYFLVSGTRNTDYNPLKEVVDPTNYRHRAQELFRDRLNKDETVYYELCYTQQNGKAIQHHSVNKKEEFGKEIAKKYGEHIEYDYGVEKGNVVAFIYRMTCGKLELSWSQILKRIREMHNENIRPVPFVGPFCNKSEIDQRILDYVGDGKDKLGEHPAEGVVLRIEDPMVPTNMSLLKLKLPTFTYLENGTKDDITFIDEEEIS